MTTKVKSKISRGKGGNFNKPTNPHINGKFRAQRNKLLFEPAPTPRASDNYFALKAKKQAPRLTPDNIAFSETDLIASICRQSFYEFLIEFWDVFVPGEPLQLNWHIKFLCDELQKVAERVFRNEPKLYDLIVNISPGTSKSSIISIAFPAWVHTRMAKARILCGSHTWELVQDLSRKSRDIVIETDRIGGRPSYQQCFPEIQLREDQNTKGYFANTKGGWRKGVTVGGKTPTGFHAHFLIVDDPLDPEKALSKKKLDTANRWMNDTLPSRKVDKKVSVTILIMQRLHQNDPTGNWLSKDGFPVRHISLPADCRQYEVKPKRLKKYYVDGLMDARRLPRSVLKDLEKKSQYSYAGQYGQNPIPLGGGMFKLRGINIAESVPTHIIETVRFWDKAATHEDGDYTVGVLIGVDKLGRFWILDVVRGQWDTYERELVIKAAAQRDRAALKRRHRIGVEEEGGSSGKDSSKATVRNLAGHSVEALRSTGDKATRAEPFSSQWNAGNIYIAKALWNTEYIDELRFFPNGTHDDQVDASSGAFNMLAGKKRAGGLW